MGARNATPLSTILFSFREIMGKKKIFACGWYPLCGVLDLPLNVDRHHITKLVMLIFGVHYAISLNNASPL